MPKNRTHTILALSVVAVGAVVSAILGLFAYMSVTATPIHADLRHVRSVTHSVPLPQWLGAVDEGRQIVRGSLVAQNLPGVSVAVGIGGDIVWAEGFGWADLENRVPVAPETRFRIADVSIPLTSAAVGLLIEKKKLNLDDQIQTYVPDFPKKDWPVTVRQLMGHVAGVRTDAGDEEPISIHCGRPGEALQRFASDRLKFEPGTEYRRSSYGWILVSAAVEAAAKRPFFTFMRTQIFEPLGMEDTRPDSSKESPTDRVTFYHPRFAGDTRYGPELVREGDYSCLAGGSGFLSTPSDLVRFGMAISGGKLLQPATVKTLQTSQQLASGAETGYGLRWDLESVSIAGETTQQVGHDGEFFIGGATSLITFPERGLVVAVMTNTSFADTNAVALAIAQAFAEQGKSPARK